MKIKEIKITRAEGATKDVGVAHIVKSWDEANSVLKKMSSTAPERSGYDKCDFSVTWDTGDIYKGRYDLKHWRCELPDLRQHVKDNALFWVGAHKPSHLREGDYSELLETEGDSGWAMRGFMGKVLATSDLLERPFGEPEAGQAVHAYFVRELEDGRYQGLSWTNDNLDHGVESEEDFWEIDCKDREALEALTSGLIHVGCSGVQVLVFEGDRLLDNKSAQPRRTI